MGKKGKKKPSQSEQQSKPDTSKAAAGGQGDQPKSSDQKGSASDAKHGRGAGGDGSAPQKSVQQRGGDRGGPASHQQTTPRREPQRQPGGPPQRQQGPGPMAKAPGQPQVSSRPTQGGRGVPPQQGQQQRPPPGYSQPQQQQHQRQGPPGRQDSRSSSESSSVQKLTSGIEKLNRSDEGDDNIVAKIKYKPGVQGRVIKVESNHLQLNLGRLETAYHYDVQIDPDKPKKFLRTAVEAFRRKHFPNRWPAFDGKKNVYTASPLTGNLNDVIEDQVTLNDENGREKVYKVVIKFANTVDMRPLQNLLNSPATPQEALQVVDIVLRMAPASTCFPVGRSFFLKPANGIIDLGEGMEMYHGFYQSAIRGWKPLLNVDVAHKAFPKNINVVDALAQLLTTFRYQVRREDLRALDRFQEDKLAKFIKTLRVTYEIPGHPGSKKNYRVNGLGAPPSVAKFNNNGQEITINNYFTQIKNFRLRYPDLPTLWVGNQERKDKMLLPIELCVIVEGQALNRKMTEQQTSNLIKQAATDTPTRKDKIMRGVNQANYNQNACVKEFGFSVKNEFQKLDARVLNPPVLRYANTDARVSRGVWRNEKFLKPVTINVWTICTVCRYAPRPDELKKMANLFERTGRDVGMTFASKATEPFGNVGGRQTYNDVEQYFRSQKNKFDVIFVIVSDSGPEYSYVKKAAEIAVGCLTQCIKSGTVAKRMNPQTAINILLKVNSKLNGVNHSFNPATKPNIFLKPIMIMGADVTHPGPESKDIPSVAAVTASHDPNAFKYNICWRLQNPKAEIIEDLEAIVEEHLKFFYKETKVKPVSIVFFRDGVSEGQFAQVKREEIRAIRSACKRLQSEGFEPKITFVVVQKRHHTRLFPTNPRDSEDRNCNVPAGTCVDTDITHPFLQDFYLVSHASIQGVAKPTKYVTLWDDNDLDNDEVEKLAYYLCHMFTRCNRSVSYPAPTYYAHLAAARGKVYIEQDRLNMDRLRDEYNRKYQIKDEIRKDRPMFFV